MVTTTEDGPSSHSCPLYDVFKHKQIKPTVRSSQTPREHCGCAQASGFVLHPGSTPRTCCSEAKRGKSSTLAPLSRTPQMQPTKNFRLRVHRCHGRRAALFTAPTKKNVPNRPISEFVHTRESTMLMLNISFYMYPV